MTTRIRAQVNQSHEGGVAIFIFRQESKGEPSHRGTVVFAKAPVAVGEAMAHSVHLSNGDAQEIFDDLWRGGFRPTDGIVESVAPSVVEAKNEHIADLRGLIHKWLERSQSSS